MTDTVTEAGTPPSATDAALEVLRDRRRRPLLLRGFGPAVVAALLALLMVLLAPSNAPERIVEREVGTESDEGVDQ